MLTRFVSAFAFAMLFGLTWNMTLALSPLPETDPSATRDAYTSGLFLDYLQSVMRMRW
jgi:hypothetical protein